MEKYTVEKFIEDMTNEIQFNSKAFIENMNHLKMEQKSFREWLGIFIAWMEWEEDWEN